MPVPRYHHRGFPPSKQKYITLRMWVNYHSENSILKRRLITSVVGIRSGTYSFISCRRDSSRSAAQVVIIVFVVVVVETDPLLLVIMHQTFIVSIYLERPPYFFPGRLSHPSQGSVLGGVQLDNPNGIKHPYRIGIVPVAVAVPLVPVHDVTVIVRPP